MQEKNIQLHTTLSFKSNKKIKRRNEEEPLLFQGGLGRKKEIEWAVAVSSPREQQQLQIKH